MQLANLESREVLLAKLAGAMKGSLAKAARVFDALRIKLEMSEPSTIDAVAEVSEPSTIEAVAEVSEPSTIDAVAEVSEPSTIDAVAEVPAEAVTTDVVSEELTTSTEEKE